MTHSTCTRSNLRNQHAVHAVHLAPVTAPPPLPGPPPACCCVCVVAAGSAARPLQSQLARMRCTRSTTTGMRPVMRGASCSLNLRARTQPHTGKAHDGRQ